MESDQALLSQLMSKLFATFKIRDLGEPNFFLDIETVKNNDGIILSQQQYMNDILTRAGMTNCKPLSTPISVSKVVPFNADLYDDPTQYRSLAGALQYLTVTRPDLSFAVNQLYQHMHAPTTSHWKQLKRVLMYVKGTIGYGLRIQRCASKEIHAFSDSDWAGCPKDRKSTNGFAVFLGNNLISWVCKKQRTVARSSTEAEYKALADCGLNCNTGQYNVLLDGCTIIIEVEIECALFNLDFLTNFSIISQSCTMLILRYDEDHPALFLPRLNELYNSIIGLPAGPFQ
ncbi:PREDICTED: uncharacterized protein LOC109183634 [Ipomoea nil]|uniref:uncharacterized protein LOC109183634 n=1 Tax=Ipomoea nil TaxID=35883 RepID=UPI000901ABD7|nr:PREDICTED: uncharacterized protein LOC109183634 [Ipomoea nil]